VCKPLTVASSPGKVPGVNSPEILGARLAETLAPLLVEADLDLVIVVGDEPELTIRFADGRAALVTGSDPDRTVRLHVTAEGAAAVMDGTANAQRLLASGDLRVGGRIDVLQANAAALAALGAESNRG